jgi:predicted nucleic acid-binding protein
LTVVIDASVAIKWVLEEPGSEQAISLQDEELIAPALWLIEAANALWRRFHAAVGTAPTLRDHVRLLGG